MAVPAWRNDVAANTALEPSPDLSAEKLAAAAAGRAEIEPEAGAKSRRRSTAARRGLRRGRQERFSRRGDTAGYRG